MTKQISIPGKRSRIRWLPQDNSLLKYICLAPAVIYDSIFFLLPLVFLVWIGFWSVENYRAVPGFSLANYSDIFSQFFVKSRYAYAIAQSLWVAITTTALGILLCYPFAMALMFLVPERLQRLLLVLAITPFWTSYILRLYAWQTILNNNGLLNTLLIQLKWVEQPVTIMFTQWGTRIGLLHYLAPIIILILYLVLRNTDRSLLGAARNLGATQWQTFWRVILPLSKPGIVYSAVFGLIISLGDVLSGIILGGGTGQSVLGKFPLFSTVILNEYAASTNLPRTSALATILIGIMMIILVSGLKLTESES
ncbi:ABC transporter permease [Cyanobacteria bacterium FACHB-471]|nr:ABC transporter permease [Cyanobacteria bacterium FACHB-471]